MNPAADATTIYTTERMLLGALLLHPDKINEVYDRTKPQYFADERHELVWKAIDALFGRGDQVDFVSVNAELGGTVTTEYLGSLIDGVPAVKDVTPWAEHVRESARRRAVADMGASLQMEALASDVATDELLDKYQSAIIRLLEGATTDHSVSIKDALRQADENIGRFMASDGGITGVPTGITSYDKLLGGLQPQALNIVAARPGRCKSVFCSQVAVHAAMRGYPVLAFTLEMPPRQLAERMWLSEARLQKWDLRQADVKDTAFESLTRARGRLEGLPIIFNDLESPNLNQLRSYSKRVVASHGVKLIIIDYLQRCATDRKVDRWQGLGDLARGIKGLSRTLDVPILCAAQLNREAEQQRPTLANLRECGDLEQEADTVSFLHPENPADKDSPLQNFWLLVDKHRVGALRKIDLVFERNYARLVEAVSAEGYTQ